MTQLVENYLHELYLYEELMQIDENFITRLKQFKEDKLKQIGSKMKKAFDMGDMQKVRTLASIIPKPSNENLDKLGRKISPSYKQASKEAAKQLGQKFAGLPEAETRLISMIVSIINNNADDVVEGVTNTIKKLKKVLKSSKVKKFGGGGEAAVGTGLVISAAVIGISAFLAMNFPILLAALLISGVALAFLMEATRQHATG